MKCSVIIINAQVEDKYDKWQQTDNKSFHFNLQSNNNRLDKPMKFEITYLYFGGICLFEKSDEYELIELGNIILNKENEKNESCCFQIQDSFNYHGIKKALCGKDPDKYGWMHFTLNESS